MTTPIDIILQFKKTGQGDSQATQSLKELGKSGERAALELAALKAQAGDVDKKMRDLAQAVARGEKSFDAAEKELKQYKDSLVQLPGATQQAESGFSKLSKGVAIAGAALATAAVAAKEVYQFIGEGAALDAARTKFENLSASIGTTSDAMLGDLRTATKGMVSDAELMASASQIISLGLSDTQDGVTRLATVISGLGLDMQQVILTFANNSTARLDALGLSITDVKTKAAELEAQGFKGDSFDEAVLIALEQKMVLLGDASQTTAGQLAILESSWKNLTDQLKEAGAAVAAPIVGALAGDIQTQKQLTAAYQDGTLAYKDWLALSRQSRQEGGLSTEVMQEYGIGITNTANAIASTAEDVEEMVRQSEQLRAATAAVEAAQADLAMQTYAAGGSYNQAAESASSYDTALLQNYRNIQATNNAEIRWQQAMERSAETADEVAAAHAAAAAERAKFAAETGDLFTAFSEADGALKFFNEGIDELGQQFVAVGGRTAEQSADLERLQTAYNKAAQTVRDYELGIKGANLSDEARADKIAEQQAIMAQLSTSMQPLLGISSEMVAVNNQLSVNQDAVTQAMISAADAAGADAGQIALLKVATGELTPVQAEAVIKSVALEQTLKNLGQQYAEGTLTLSGYMTAAQQAVADINAMQVSFDTTTGTVTTTNDAVATLIDSIGRLPTQHDFVIKITQDGEIPTLPSGPSNAQAAAAFAEGGLITGGTAVTGYGQDNVMIAATTGEYVLKPSAVRKLGLSRLNQMNSTGRLPGFADGGYIGDDSTTSTAGASVMFAPVIHVSGVVDRQQAIATGQNVLDGLTQAARARGVRI